MKKTIAALFAIASAAVFAGINEVRITFSTPGQDKYADGTTVLDGEWYALVCTKGDTKEIVDASPIAKDGRCPWHTFVIKEELLDYYAGGVLGVCLLDTRDFGTDPSGATLTEERDAKGYPVYNVMAVAKGELKLTSNFATAPANAAVSAGSYALASAGVKDPTVTDIKVVGDEVLVTVANTVPFVGYTLQSGDDKFSFITLPDVKSLNGNASGTITLKAPKKDGAQFFKVSSIQ